MTVILVKELNRYVIGVESWTPLKGASKWKLYSEVLGDFCALYQPTTYSQRRACILAKELQASSVGRNYDVRALRIGPRLIRAQSGWIKDWLTDRLKELRTK